MNRIQSKEEKMGDSLRQMKEVMKNDRNSIDNNWKPIKTFEDLEFGVHYPIVNFKRTAKECGINHGC